MESFIIQGIEEGVITNLPLNNIKRISTTVDTTDVWSDWSDLTLNTGIIASTHRIRSKGKLRQVEIRGFNNSIAQESVLTTLSFYDRPSTNIYCHSHTSTGSLLPITIKPTGNIVEDSLSEINGNLSAYYYVD